MPQNIELKIKVSDLSVIAERAIRHGAREVGLLIQRDTFYPCPNGRLKLREIENDHDGRIERSAELIAYARSDDASARTSDYTLTIVPDPKSLHETLARSLGVRGVVAKRRRLLLWRNVRIHLDVVESLGTYLELESVVGVVDAQAASGNLQELIDLLEIRDLPIEPRAYVDLLDLRDT